MNILSKFFLVFAFKKCFNFSLKISLKFEFDRIKNINTMYGKIE